MNRGENKRSVAFVYDGDAGPTVKVGGTKVAGFELFSGSTCDFFFVVAFDDDCPISNPPTFSN